MAEEPWKTEQLEILSSLPPGESVVMLNLLRFYAIARYKDSTEPCSGSEAYERYSKIALPALAKAGASMVFMGRPAASLIGPADERWHLMLLVKYPSVDAFRSMVSAPEYQAALKHRTAALQDSRLIPVTHHTAHK
jgi:uncharacterized protein (DUF1330 family)